MYQALATNLLRLGTEQTTYLNVWVVSKRLDVLSRTIDRCYIISVDGKLDLAIPSVFGDVRPSRVVLVLYEEWDGSIFADMIITDRGPRW